MLLKCFVFLLIIVINTESIESVATAVTTAFKCPYPSLNHGRVRVRQRARLVKFMCNVGYDLIGNKYATCRNGQWDVPMPICIRSGCKTPTIENGIQLEIRPGAWFTFYCIPKHRLVGSPAIYCDGNKWNDTAPVCIDDTAPPKLSCDFEKPDLCGWMQDAYHDFDWARLNRKTPSSFLLTGPSFDHTLGKGNTGHYMYIESTSRMENHTARLISPIYDKTYAQDGCFSFFYHMYGKKTGGLRVYQKPESFAINDFLFFIKSSAVNKYLIFEKWGEQGDYWYGSVNNLQDYSDNFQIIIEGIRGPSFTSDIAIDDVSIMQGDNCTLAKKAFEINIDSCVDRCDLPDNPLLPPACGCNTMCVINSNCCLDYMDVCAFSPDQSTTMKEDDNAQTTPSSANHAPQTEKLVATTSSSTSSTVTRTTIPTTKLTTPRTVKTTPTTVKTTKNPTKPTTTSSTSLRTTAKTSTTTRRSITLVYKKSTPAPINGGPINATTKVDGARTKSIRTTKLNDSVTVKYSYDTQVQNAKLEQERKQMGNASVVDSPSSSVQTAAIVIGVLMCVCACAWAVVTLRGHRGVAVLAMLRSRSHDQQEVRFLTRDEEIDTN